MLAVLLAVVLAWFGRKYSKILYARHYVWKDFVSPPLDSYLTGHKNSLKKAQADNTFTDLMMGWVREYGDVILIWRDYKPVFFITDPVILEQLWSNVIDFKKLNNLPNRNLYSEVVTGTRSFLTTTGGLPWALKRKMMSGFFTKANQKIVFPKMQQLVQKSVSDLRGLEGDETIFDMEEGFATMAENLLIVCGLDNLNDMFSTKPGYLARNIITLLEVLPRASRGAASKQYMFSKDAQQALEFIRNVRYDISVSYKELLKVTQSKEGSSDEYMDKLGLLGTIIRANQHTTFKDNVENLQDADAQNEADFINDIVTLILVADNLAKVVSILFAKVVREKEIYEKLRAEIHSTDISNYEDLKKLKYTDMVILETMRWCPILQRGARVMKDTSTAWKNGEIKIGDKVLPYNGEAVDFQWSQYVMHHHPNYWKDPETFDPERFANGTSEFVRNSYIPFIGGPRACLGKHLAMAKMKIMIYKMLRAFDMASIVGEDKLELDRKYTIVKVRQGKHVVLKTRPLTSL